jgi:hypothetical protein
MFATSIGRERTWLSHTVRQPVWALAFIGLLGALLGAWVGAAATYRASSGWGIPQPVSGNVIAVNQDATTVTFQPDDWPHRDDGGADGGWSYRLGPVEWVDNKGQSWGNGTPACLAPLSHGQRVQLWLLEIRGGENPAHSNPVIVRVNCLA